MQANAQSERLTAEETYRRIQQLLGSDMKEAPVPQQSSMNVDRVTTSSLNSIVF